MMAFERNVITGCHIPTAMLLLESMLFTKMGSLFGMWRNFKFKFSSYTLRIPIDRILLP